MCCTMYFCMGTVALVGSQNKNGSRQVYSPRKLPRRGCVLPIANKIDVFPKINFGATKVYVSNETRTFRKPKRDVIFTYGSGSYYQALVQLADLSPLLALEDIRSASHADFLKIPGVKISEAIENDGGGCADDDEQPTVIPIQDLIPRVLFQSKGFVVFVLEFALRCFCFGIKTISPSQIQFWDSGYPKRMRTVLWCLHFLRFLLFHQLIFLTACCLRSKL